MSDGAAEAAFKLEMILMRQDYTDPTVSTHTLNQHILRVARRYRLETWLVRGLVEERWKEHVGQGVLKCAVCGRPYANHPIGHCPDLDGEPVVLDAVSHRTQMRRKNREKQRVSQ